MLDIGSGLAAATAILAALLARTADGLGRTVSSSLLEFALSCFTSYAADVLETGTAPGLLGNDSPQFAPYGVFRCQDGAIALAGAGSEQLWQRLCEVLGRPGWAADPRFASNAGRLRHRGELTAEIEQVLGAAGTAHWQRVLDEAGIPASPVRPPGDALTSPQAAALGMLHSAATPDGHPYQTVRPPLSVGGPARYSRARPPSASTPPRCSANSGCPPPLWPTCSPVGSWPDERHATRRWSHRPGQLGAGPDHRAERDPGPAGARGAAGGHRARLVAGRRPGRDGHGSRGQRPGAAAGGRAGRRRAAAGRAGLRPPGHRVRPGGQARCATPRRPAGWPRRRGQHRGGVRAQRAGRAAAPRAEAPGLDRRDGRRGGSREPGRGPRAAGRPARPGPRRHRAGGRLPGPGQHHRRRLGPLAGHRDRAGRARLGGRGPAQRGA